MDASAKNSMIPFYAGILSLKPEEKAVLLRRLGAKALRASDEEKFAFARAAIACGAVGMAAEAVQGIENVPELVTAFLEDSVALPDSGENGVLKISDCSSEMDPDPARIMVDGICSCCSAPVKLDILSPRIGRSGFLCPHCLAALEIDVDEIRPYLEEAFSSHMKELENRLRRRQLSSRDCVHLVQLADAVSPWLLVRFGVMRSERIGHFALNTEKYLSERAAGITNPDTFDFLGDNHPVSNRFMSRMWQRVVRYSPVASVIAPMLAPDSPYNTEKDLRGNNGRDEHMLFHRAAPELSFTEREKEMALNELERMGIGQDAQYICLNVRDGAYLKSHLKHRDWSYHDFRDSDIETYEDVALALAEKGMFVLRMGAKTSSRFEVDHPRIIDYSNLYRSEFMDVFLCATCKFMISTGTGIDGIAFIFRRPVLYVNYAQAGAVVDWEPRSVTMFKRFFWKDSGRELSLKELFSCGVSRVGHKEELDVLGVALKDNSPYELKMAGLEMNDLVEMDFKVPLTDVQREANTIVRPNGNMLGRLSGQYLQTVMLSPGSDNLKSSGKVDL
ncbi:TIGR04372 family glycosyltransferase [Maridesulfovibrio sp.]|uniref:TIGR04372 family glycosyltransferase n=1 Tax=Maridesulfovibrio sp. TaxID=2795000 RepID=UPI002A186F36|nr:TIGR04372 family glycosyltransferase [Maridesulfovibrio sp.]